MRCLGMACVALAAGSIALGCRQTMPAAQSEPPRKETRADLAESDPSFASDLAFLEEHGPVTTLEAKSGAVVAVSARYQGRVMTSAVSRDGLSLGYLNRSFIESGKTGTQFDNYGGEDRFWLGPEGGQFALYFPSGKPFAFEHWQTPAALQEGSWDVSAKSESEVTLRRSMKLMNYSGAVYEMDVTRSVRLLDAAAVGDLFGPSAPSLDGLGWVAFETVNQITNTGAAAWTKETGAPSIWILAMYNPSPDTWAIIPFEPGGTGPIVNDAYFGKVPAERLRVLDKEGVLLFRCDGQHRSKIGLGPERAKPFAGSYSKERKLLTIVHFDRVASSDYVNSMWELQDEPFGGDVVNSYNDGPVEPGKAALGGFYELETSSPAAFLEPGQSLTHTHRTLHFVGEQAALEPFSERAFGISLDTVHAGARRTEVGRWNQRQF